MPPTRSEALEVAVQQLMTDPDRLSIAHVILLEWAQANGLLTATENMQLEQWLDGEVDDTPDTVILEGAGDGSTVVDVTGRLVVYEEPVHAVRMHQLDGKLMLAVVGVSNRSMRPEFVAGEWTTFFGGKQ